MQLDQCGCLDNFFSNDVLRRHRRNGVNVFVVVNFRLIFEFLFLVFDDFGVVVGRVHVARRRRVADAALAAGKAVGPASAEGRPQLEGQCALKNVEF